MGAAQDFSAEHFCYSLKHRSCSQDQSVESWNSMRGATHRRQKCRLRPLYYIFFEGSSWCRSIIEQDSRDTHKFQHFTHHREALSFLRISLCTAIELKPCFFLTQMTDQPQLGLALSDDQLCFLHLFFWNNSARTGAPYCELLTRTPTIDSPSRQDSRPWRSERHRFNSKETRWLEHFRTIGSNTKWNEQSAEVCFSYHLRWGGSLQDMTWACFLLVWLSKCLLPLVAFLPRLHREPLNMSATVMWNVRRGPNGKSMRWL